MAVLRPGVIAAGPVGDITAVHATGPAGFDGPAPQLVGTPEAPLPGLVPPDNGMFDLNADPDAPFMVTTAPRFAPDGSIGSDHLLAFGSDQHKRLRDGLGLAQYRTLMDNAA